MQILFFCPVLVSSIHDYINLFCINYIDFIKTCYRNFFMKYQMIRFTMLVCLILFSKLGLSFEIEKIIKIDKVSFVSGGVGDESIARMHLLFKDFNFRLLFAALDGHYLSDVTVRIVDADGNVVMDTISQGPWMLVNLTPGMYLITATYEDKSVIQKTNIRKSGPRELVFRWKESPFSED